MKLLLQSLIILSPLVSMQAFASNTDYLNSVEGMLATNNFAYLCEGHLTDMSLEDARAKLQPNETIGRATSQDGGGTCLVLKRKPSQKS